MEEHFIKKSIYIFKTNVDSNNIIFLDCLLSMNIIFKNSINFNINNLKNQCTKVLMFLYKITLKFLIVKGKFLISIKDICDKLWISNKNKYLVAFKNLKKCKRMR